MADKQRILIVDDDTNIAELIELYLTKECFQCEQAHDGEMALKKHTSFQPDLILLDIMLPGIDGYDVCREIRKTSSVPIIMLSAKGEVFDKVLGLELGADDYIMKPFDSKELVARVKAVLRRYHPGGPSSAETSPSTGGKASIQYKDLTVSLSNYSVTYMGSPIEMPPKSSRAGWKKTAAYTAVHRNPTARPDKISRLLVRTGLFLRHNSPVNTAASASAPLRGSRMASSPP